MHTYLEKNFVNKTFTQIQDHHTALQFSNIKTNGIFKELTIKFGK